MLKFRSHELAWGGPGFEVIIDGRPYEIQFNQPPREIIIGTRPHLIYICGDAPDVKICGRVPDELLYPNNENMKQEPDYSVSSVPSFNPPRPQPVPLMSQHTSSAPIASSSMPSGLGMLTQLDLPELVKKLNAYGILPKPKASEEAKIAKKEASDALAAKEKQQQAEELKIPDLTGLDNEMLKQKYPGAIQNLYSGVQCAQCGNRFNQQSGNSENAKLR